MRQTRITTKNIDYPQDNDCYIAPDDPLNDIKKSLMLGGLGSQVPTDAKDTAALRDYFKSSAPQYKNSATKGDVMAMPNITHTA